MAQGPIHLRVDLLHHVPAVVQTGQRIAIGDLGEDPILHHQIEVFPLQRTGPVLERTQAGLRRIGNPDHIENLVDQLPFLLVERPSILGADRAGLIELQTPVEHP